jgi:hypothetical protein
MKMPKIQVRFQIVPSFLSVKLVRRKKKKNPQHPMHIPEASHFQQMEVVIITVHCRGQEFAGGKKNSEHNKANRLGYHRIEDCT